ncbi:MAG: hypothetical protein IT365_07655 [Candidatus Hydrogenedentes bacterium]|nr:hypothetical protein [Candidatus Hydrogenedentota bacterium]
MHSSVSVAAVLLVCGGSGCPLNPGSSGVPVIDLAVGDSGSGFFLKGDAEVPPFASPKMLLYFDVLSGDNQQDPDVVLDAVDVPSIARPISTVLTEDDLYVAGDDSWVVSIWRDYRSLADKGDGALAPDVELTGLETLAYPHQIIVSSNRLFVLNRNPFIDGGKGKNGFTYGVHVFFDAAGITEDRAPDRVFADAIDPMGMAVDGDDLYVADSLGGRVLIYRDIDEELLPPKALLAYDAELAGPSWAYLDDDGPLLPLRVDVFDNTLYVTTASNFLFVFDSADTLVSLAEPSAVIAESNGALATPWGAEAVGNRLFVGNLNTYAMPVPFKGVVPGLSGEATIGMVGFDGAPDLAIGQQPSVVFDASNAQVPAVRDMSVEEDVLFAATAVPGSAVLFDYDNKAAETRPVPFFASYYAVGDVHIYTKADHILFGRPGGIVLPAMKDFFGPLSIDTNRKLTGSN